MAQGTASHCAESKINMETFQVGPLIPVDPWIHLDEPIWTRPPGTIRSERMHRLYSLLFQDEETPVHIQHFKVTGPFDIRVILFAPATAPVNLLAPLSQPDRRVVLAGWSSGPMAFCPGLLPEWLYYVRAVVASPEIGMVRCHAQLQTYRFWEVLKWHIATEAFNMLQEVAGEWDEYNNLYDQVFHCLLMRVDRPITDLQLEMPELFEEGAYDFRHNS